ncbi:MAG: deacetylase [Bacillota bacterium]
MLQNHKMGDYHADKPAFLITIDTEGDNLWAKPHLISTENACYLFRFQAFCEQFSLRPTYLTNWEMANCPVFRAFGRNLLTRNAGEIGMHLHAWNSPPFTPLTDDDYVHQPYLTEYPEDQLRQKVQVLTECLEQTFQTQMVSHRAGRWGFNEVYAKALIDYGYRVDCSVTPHLSWRQYIGSPDGAGGPDFTNYPETAYFLDPSDISRPGQSTLLEVPLTVTAPHFGKLAHILPPILRMAGSFGHRVARHFFPLHARMVPNGRNRRLLLDLLLAAIHYQRDYVQLTLHSSELMPGASPNFLSPCSIERLYDDLNAVFTFVRDRFVGLTLREYHDRRVASPAPAQSAVGTLR